MFLLRCGLSIPVSHSKQQKICLGDFTRSLSRFPYGFCEHLACLDTTIVFKMHRQIIDRRYVSFENTRILNSLKMMNLGIKIFGCNHEESPDF